MKMLEKQSLGQRFFDFWIPDKKDSKKKKIGKMVSLFTAFVLIASVALAALVFAKYFRAAQTVLKYKELYPPANSLANANDIVDQNTGIMKKFDELLAVNKEVVGYIDIPNTKLSYPVMQALDNEYYLDKTLYREEEPFGIPFADYRATISRESQSTNVTIYGHSAVDGSFFAAIKKFKDIDYYKEHPTLSFNTIYGDGDYKIVGVFVEDVNPNHGEYFNYHDFVDAADDDQFNAFVEAMQTRSYYDTGVDIAPTDHLVTLSTCDTEINKRDFRIVLVARRLRNEESLDVDVSKAKINKEQIMPKLWVSKKDKANIYS